MTEKKKDQPVVVIERDGGVGSFLFGIALGAGLALLLAPMSGEAARRELKNRGRRLRATAAEKAEQLQDVLSSGYEETKTRVEEGFSSARRVVEEKRDGARDAVRAGRAAVHTAREELERRLSDRRAAGGDDDIEDDELDEYADEDEERVE